MSELSRVDQSVEQSQVDQSGGQERSEDVYLGRRLFILQAAAVLGVGITGTLATPTPAEARCTRIFDNDPRWADRIRTRCTTPRPRARHRYVADSDRGRYADPRRRIY